MAFEYCGNLWGNVTPVINRFMVGEDMYVGQLVETPSDTGGHCLVLDNAAAGPDVTNAILGIVMAVVTSPTYDSTYQGDKATYDTTQANQLLNDPKGACLVDVLVLYPGALIKGPICNGTVGTALTELIVTAVSTTGAAVNHTGNAITAMDDDYSTVYCRKGANRGLSRVITTGGTKTQTVTITFPYDTAVGDTFVAAQMTLGACRVEFDSQKQAFNGNDDLTEYFVGYCHQLNLEESGKEWAIWTPHANHLWDL